MLRNVNEKTSGVTWRTFTALLTTILFFTAPSVYLTLTVGAGAISQAAVFVVLIIFSEITRYFGKPLSKQELFILFSVIAMVTSLSPPYYWLIWRVFAYVQHPVFSKVILLDKPLFDLVPSWLIPKDLMILEQRTFFAKDWFVPLAVNLTIVFLAYLQSVSLGMLFGYVFVEVEKLDYPMGKVQASVISTLSERTEEHMKIFIFSIIVGAGLGIAVYAPQIIGSTIIPLPWADFTSITQDFIPGAIIGLSTDPFGYVTGMIIPINVAVCALISSIIVYVLMNNLLLTTFSDVFPRWREEFYYGMNIAAIQYRSYLRIWLPVQFGMTIGMALLYIVVIRKDIYRSMKLLLRATRTGERSDFPSLSIIFGLFLASSLASCFTYIYLVPGYNPFLVVTVSLGYSFLASLISARALGIGAVSPTIAWPWRIVTYFSGYKGFTGWDSSPAIETGLSAQIVQAFKVARLTGTRLMDYLKMLTIGYVSALLLNLFFYDFFWRIAPIPSSVYPFTLMYWPQYMLEVLMFSTGQIIIEPHVILLSIICAMIVVAIETGLKRFRIPFSAMGFMIGVFQIPPYTIAFLIGSLMSNLVIPRFIPDWRKMIFTTMAGIVAGLSISVGIGVAVSFLMKAPWIWPW